MYHAPILNLGTHMAVYTQLEFGEIDALVAPLNLGRLIAAEGIAAGVENTTYFLSFADTGNSKTPKQYVLTIAETLSSSDLEFIATLMHDLNAHGLPVPAPIFKRNNSAASGVLSVHDKPALLAPKIAGTHPQSVTPDLCSKVGGVLGKLHLVTLALEHNHISHRSLAWVTTTAKSLLPYLGKTEQELLNQEIKDLTEFVSTNIELPQAIIHGDLFRDNVLVNDGAITAIIDFFSAGAGYLLLDLAIAVNDWCFDGDGKLNINNYNALTRSYCAVRKPTLKEIACWGQILRIAALRFWVSRLNEHHTAGPHAPRGRGKNPSPYRQLLLLHRDSPPQLTP